MSVNKAILIGNLGSDPEVRYTQSGTAVGNFNVATNEKWTDQNGQRQERTEWHRVVVWGKQAEICKQYLTKGRQVYVEGRITYRQWQDNQGQKRDSTEIVAQTVRFLGGGGGGAAGGGFGGGGGPSGGGGGPSGGGYGGGPSGGGGGQQGGGYGGPMDEPPPMDGFSDDDIPF
jgi:single-strand DNA-binding protein